MMFGAKGCNETTIKICEGGLNENTMGKFGSVAFDQSFSFKKFLKALCKEASQRPNAHARMSRYRCAEKLEKIRLVSFQLLPARWDAL